MEAGYDYLLLRGRLQRKFFRYSGIIILVFGALLLATGGAYYGYAAKARADLDDLNVTIPGASLAQNQAQNQVQAPDTTTTDNFDDSSPTAQKAVDTFSGQQNDPIKAPGSAKVLPSLSSLAINAKQLYPGEALSAASWSNPWSFEPLAYRSKVLLQGFSPIEPGAVPPAGALDAATRIIMPSIGIDSIIGELEIFNLGDSRAYETPDRIVGHIPETANAGEAGSSWFFGHTESPTLGEGSIFFNLQQVPGKLRNSEDVFIITETGQTQYLYRVTSSQVVHQDYMALYETGQATIHLVSCVPRLVYDHRLIVTGELVAQKTKS